MKKIIALVLVLSVVFAFAACKGGNDPTTAPDTTAAPADDTTAAPADDTTAAPADDTKAEGVMTYAEYIAAELDTEVTVETYVQAKQGWWTDDNTGKSQASFYTQDQDGAYFLYNMECTEEEYAQLVPGTKIKVTGFKSDWKGETEITDAKFEIEEGSFIAEALDVTALLGTDELEAHKNEFVSFKGMTVEASADADGNEAAFLYAWDGSGSAEANSDLYFKVSKDGATYTFTVESYLCGSGTDVYKAVEGLNVGDVIDLEGFLYWYDSANPHITAVTTTENAK